jgi:hypothetical protein
VLSSGVPPVSWRWYEDNISPRFPLPAEFFQGLAGGPPGYRAAAAGLVKAAGLMREGEKGPCVFYRFRKASAQGRDVRVSPLGMADWTRYFQYRILTAAPGRMRAAGWHLERVIRDREEEEGARRIKPFRRRWAWAGTWGPLAMAGFWIVWALAADAGGPDPAVVGYGGPGRLYGPLRALWGSGFFLFGVALGLGVCLVFWGLALLEAERSFTRFRRWINGGAMAVGFCVYLGMSFMNIKSALLVANFATLLAWRQLLGILLKRKLLAEGVDPD